jgi:hypothetical protein
MSILEVFRRIREDSLAHTQHPVNFLDTKPMEDIGHQRLESHVLHTSNVLGSLEILRGPIQSALSGIVDKVLQQGVRKQLGKKDKSKGVGGQDRNAWGCGGSQ